MKKFAAFLLLILLSFRLYAQPTQKPMLYGSSWMAITGKPLAATAGSMIFQQGGNAVDAACAMLAATCTMWDTLSWGGETQALIYNPKTKQVIAINAMGVAPTGATAAFFKNKGYQFPPEYGPLSATTPGTPGGLIFMLHEYGTMSLAQVLAPALQMAKGYPIEAQAANTIERQKDLIKQWPYSKRVLLPHLGAQREAPEGGELFSQPDLFTTLSKLVQAETEALRKGKSRKQALMAAYDRFYKGDIAKEFVRGCQEQGGLITLADLAAWKPIAEDALSTTYKGIEVYKLKQWTQGPVLLQALNILENFDLKAMGYNSPEYIHTVYQAMNLAFADRDFYYGDPAQLPAEPMKGLLSKAYAKQRAALINPARNDAKIGPGDPFPFQNQPNPYLNLLKARGYEPDSSKRNFAPKHDLGRLPEDENYHDRLWRGTTSIEAADKEGWVVSVTPSGGWLPACIAGNTGIGMSQRMQSFVLDPALNPFNVVAPGKRPRVTLSPSLFLKDGKPYLSAAVQGGDTQDQNLLQFFLNVADFNMPVQKATEAPNFNTNQLWLSLGGTKVADREPKPGQILLQSQTPATTREALLKKGYQLSFSERTSGPINAIWFDWKHKTLWGGSSNHGEDYGIAW
ncbi:gamma-glutamyltransferase [Pedobacter yulinensis]|uniref:Gamma-glutamyltransferase n=1 Tax=Pedobacter yulinensis TaxID=2126353 RepID=A0A2T3HPJ9_9SPHI|nr:gamma-glutamyltransferase [Pedobacter yulinensis]PST84333.1 gamma-glutamyltransferase [Pedobacter yulinensis]